MTKIHFLVHAIATKFVDAHIEIRREFPLFISKSQQFDANATSPDKKYTTERKLYNKKLIRSNTSAHGCACQMCCTYLNVSGFGTRKIGSIKRLSREQSWLLVQLCRYLKRDVLLFAVLNVRFLTESNDEDVLNRRFLPRNASA